MNPAETYILEHTPHDCVATTRACSVRHAQCDRSVTVWDECSYDRLSGCQCLRKTVRYVTREQCTRFPSEGIKPPEPLPCLYVIFTINMRFPQSVRISLDAGSWIHLAGQLFGNHECETKHMVPSCGDNSLDREMAPQHRVAVVRSHTGSE